MAKKRVIVLDQGVTRKRVAATMACCPSGSPRVTVIEEE